MADDMRPAKSGPPRMRLPEPLRPFEAALRARWEAMPPNARGAALVSLGSLTLVVMATVVKLLGQRLPSFILIYHLLCHSGILLLRAFAPVLCIQCAACHDQTWQPAAFGCRD